MSIISSIDGHLFCVIKRSLDSACIIYARIAFVVIKAMGRQNVDLSTNHRKSTCIMLNVVNIKAGALMVIFELAETDQFGCLLSLCPLVTSERLSTITHNQKIHWASTISKFTAQISRMFAIKHFHYPQSIKVFVCGCVAAKMYISAVVNALRGCRLIVSLKSVHRKPHANALATLCKIIDFKLTDKSGYCKMDEHKRKNKHTKLWWLIEKYLCKTSARCTINADRSINIGR